MQLQMKIEEKEIDSFDYDAFLDDLVIQESRFLRERKSCVYIDT